MADKTADAPRGIAPGPVSEWLHAHLPGASPPFDFELIAAGGSNLTYRVRDAQGRSWALRRGPVAARIATAHDMHREWRVMSALAAHGNVPVPEMIAMCEDESVNGADFYVMSFAEGRILRTAADAADMDKAQCQVAAESLVAVQAAMHQLDLEKAGLADLGKHEGYVERQLHRWRKQAEASAEHELPLLAEVQSRLLEKNPGPQAPPGLVHGDYRFDNTVLGADFCIAAVLDWELCTIGDPVADFYWSLMYWRQPEDEIGFLPDAPTCAPGFMKRATVAAIYRRQTGFDLSAADFFTAFGYWKMACIVQGVYTRLRKGAGGGMQVGRLEDVARMVERYLEEAAAYAEKL